MTSKKCCGFQIFICKLCIKTIDSFCNPDQCDGKNCNAIHIKEDTKNKNCKKKCYFIFDQNEISTPIKAYSSNYFKLKKRVKHLWYYVKNA